MRVGGSGRTLGDNDEVVEVELAPPRLNDGIDTSPPLPRAASMGDGLAG
jgi:hypothetical protein